MESVVITTHISWVSKLVEGHKNEVISRREVISKIQKVSALVCEIACHARVLIIKIATQ